MGERRNHRKGCWEFSLVRPKKRELLRRKVKKNWPKDHENRGEKGNECESDLNVRFHRNAERKRKSPKGDAVVKGRRTSRGGGSKSISSVEKVRLLVRGKESEANEVPD